MVAGLHRAVPSASLDERYNIEKIYKMRVMCQDFASKVVNPQERFLCLAT
jgi:hypothetical protein